MIFYCVAFRFVYCNFCWTDCKKKKKKTTKELELILNNATRLKIAFLLSSIHQAYRRCDWES